MYLNDDLTREEVRHKNQPVPIGNSEVARSFKIKDQLYEVEWSSKSTPHFPL